MTDADSAVLPEGVSTEWPRTVRSTFAPAGVALAFVGVGVFARSPALLLAGGAVLSLGLVARSGEAPPATLAVSRELSTDSPAAGETVTVTVHVENVGDGALADLRVVDGVPAALPVVEGSARVATALRAGEATTFSYTVEATRGVHEWSRLRAATRDLAGSRERETTVEASTTLSCEPGLGAGADLPLRGLTTPYHGRQPTDVGGSGVEFHATREYRRGDPLRRVDWNRRARTGELATLELREERAATVVLLVDARREAYAAPDEASENAVERSVEAAGQAFAALLDGGDRVGVEGLANDECWLAPGSGTGHAARARDLLATHPVLSPNPTEDPFYATTWLRGFRRRIPGDAQVLFFTPALDDDAASVARRLDAYGHLVTVVSPDVTADDTPGHALASMERAARLRALRGAGLRVVEWDDEPFPVAVAGANRRWSR